MNRTGVLVRLLLVSCLGAACGGEDPPRSRCDGDESCDEDPADGDDRGSDDEDDDDDEPAKVADAGDAPDKGTGVDASAARDSALPMSGSDASRVAPRDAATSNSPDGSVATPPMMGGPAKKSAGCGKTMFPEAGTKTIDVDGTMREYISALPQGYDPNRAYRLIFAWHGLGGTAASIARSWYGLSRRAENSTIFVAGQGLPTSGDGGAGWPNTGGRDVAFVQKLLASLLETYCIDETRIFSTGMSYGGIMSNTLGCAMGDVFRAIAPMAGSGPLGRGCKGGPAAWLTHGNMDTVVTFASGQRSRDHWAMTNGCDMQTMPVAPMGCVAYQGCNDGKPVHWCEFSGGHTVPPFAAEAIWTFFAQF